MERATKLFEEKPKKPLISYCSMIQGLSNNGHENKAVDLFNKMQNEGLVPDEVAFTVILSTCSHAGFVEEGWHYFERMRYEYSLLPSPDHYACMVDLLSKAGRLKEAYELLNSMLVEPHASAWGALLGVYKLHCNIELGEVITPCLLELEPHNAGNYVSLSNIYATADQWSDVSLVREKMKERGLGNLPSLPCPPSFDQSISAHDSEAPLVLSGDLDNLYDVEHSEVHMKGFLDFSGDASKI
ncbi:putative pentatricopeptide repeat-containing protein At5g37570 [Castanea sativa]|uniref:putative pentatricopeptide repeat-containing protein At5g37570 n=1 Tax=Castanea sativa TaxID=21020 RepID=UPI003F653F3F